MLPSAKDGPQGSPGLLCADDGGRAGQPDRLDTWVVPAIGTRAGRCLDLLLALPPACPPGLAVGDSLRFLVEAGKLALELVARGRVLPGLARDGDRWVARWRPVTDDPGDEERVGMLVRSAPALLRAELPMPDEGNPPAAVVADLLAAIVDACARSFAAGTIRAQDVWSSNGSGLTVLGRRLANPQERLLGGLGHALRLWPELEPALHDAAPTGLDLEPEAAYRFMREVAPALEQGGFGVLAPAW